MQEEYLEVVDENDLVINRMLRREIHAQGLRHRAVHILVFNRLQHVFLQKRSMRKDLNKGLWDTSAAGHVDPGEDYLSCAHRELSEELGVTAELNPLFKLNACMELGMEFIQVYYCQHDGPFSLAVDEIDDGMWLTIPEVTARVSAEDNTLTQTFRVIWKQFHYQFINRLDN